MVSLCVNQLVFFCMFSLFAIYLMRSSVITHKIVPTHSRTHARSLTRSQNTKTYCVCRMCPNLWVTWVVKSFASSVHFALSLSISSSLCIWAAMSCFVIVIYLFSFSPLLYAWDVPKMTEKKLYLISHGLHFNFRVGFFLRQTEHNFEVDFLSVAMLRYNDFMGQEQKVKSILIDWKCWILILLLAHNQ